MGAVEQPPPKPPSSTALTWTIWRSWSRARPPCARTAALSDGAGFCSTCGWGAGHGFSRARVRVLDRERGPKNPFDCGHFGRVAGKSETCLGAQRRHRRRGRPEVVAEGNRRCASHGRRGPQRFRERPSRPTTCGLSSQWVRDAHSGPGTYAHLKTGAPQRAGLFSTSRPATFGLLCRWAGRIPRPTPQFCRPARWQRRSFLHAIARRWLAGAEPDRPVQLGAITGTAIRYTKSPEAGIRWLRPARRSRSAPAR